MGLQLTAAQARAAVQTLRDGVPPEPAVSELMTCGLRRPLLEGGRTLLRVAAGAHEVTLIAGTNGAGKSHLLSLFQAEAERRRFLVSFSSQDVATRVALNRPDLVYQAVMKNLRPLRSNDDPLTTILQDWGQRAIPYLTHAAMNMGQFYVLRDHGLLPEFSPQRTTLCLLLYVWGTRQGLNDVCELATSALRGESIDNTTLCKAAEKLALDPGRIGYTPGPYKSEFWFGQLNTVIFAARAVGRAGALIILDEIESLLELGRSSSKRRAYREMSSLFSNAYSWANTWLVLAYTPAFLVGLQHDRVADAEFHDALAQVREHKEIDLPAKLDARDAECVVRHIREIFEIARGVTLRLPDPGGLVALWLQSGAPTRDLVRRSVEQCDMEVAAGGKHAPGMESASEAALRKLAERFVRR